MTVRTTTNPRFLFRLSVVGLFCWGAAAWFFYDYKIGYPAWRERGLDYQQFIEDHPEMDELERFNAWKKRAAEKGWPTTNPFYKDTEAPITQVQINGQILFTYVAGAVGAFFIGRVLLWRGCWVEADDSTLRDKGGNQCQYDQITALDKKQWNNKGIARVRYEADGRKGKMVLDDCNYDRDTTQEILRLVESKIDHAKIINGKPERPPKLTDEAPSESNDS